MGVNRKYCRCFLLEFYIYIFFFGFCAAAKLISGAFWITQCRQQQLAKGERILLVFCAQVCRGVACRWRWEWRWWRRWWCRRLEGRQASGEFRPAPWCAIPVPPSWESNLNCQCDSRKPLETKPWTCASATFVAPFRVLTSRVLTAYWSPLAEISRTLRHHPPSVPVPEAAPTRSTARIVNSLPGCPLQLQPPYSWNWNSCIWRRT